MATLVALGPTTISAAEIALTPAIATTIETRDCIERLRRENSVELESVVGDRVYDGRIRWVDPSKAEPSE